MLLEAKGCTCSVAWSAALLDFQLVLSAERRKAIDPNYAFFLSLAAGNAKQKFETVESDLRNVHRLLTASERRLCPVSHQWRVTAR